MLTNREKNTLQRVIFVLRQLADDADSSKTADIIMTTSGCRGSGFPSLQRREERTPLLSLSSKIRLMIVS